MSVTHLAGPPVGYMSRVVQRCMVCGEKLKDSRDESVMVGEGDKYRIFPVGHFVAVSGEDPVRMIVGDCFEDDDKPVPKDFCIALVE